MSEVDQTAKNIDQHEKIFFNWILKNPKYFETLSKSFFSNGDLQIIFGLAKAYYKKFEKSPSHKQCKILVQNSEKAKNRQTDEAIVDHIYDLNLDEYDEDWIQNTFKFWVQWRDFENRVDNVNELIGVTNVTPDNVEKVITDCQNLLTRNVIKLDQDLGFDFFNPEHHAPAENSKITSNWNLINNITGGGYDICSLVALVGPPNIGKSIFLANYASDFVKMGHNCALITAEMGAQKVIKRAGANLLNIPMSQYDKWAKNPDKVKKKLEYFKSSSLIPPGQLFVQKYPTSSATVTDIESYLLNVEKVTGNKLSVIVIDYINLLVSKRNPNTENTYLKIKEIAEDLRGMADRNNWLIITASQVNKEGYESSDINMKNIAESQGLPQTADMVFGIVQDETMHANNKYVLKVIKIRDEGGKNERIEFSIDYEYMRLSEERMLPAA